MIRILFTLFFVMLFINTNAVRATEMKSMTNIIAEWTFTAGNDHADPFNAVTLDAIFTDPAGKTHRVPAFWGGGKTWKVRYASPVVGKHHFKTECSENSDSGLHSVEGAVEIGAYDGKNPLYQHGPLRVAEDKKHFEHFDGTPFYWLADTQWMGLTKRLHFPEEFKTLSDDRLAKGYTVVQIIAGLYPDMPAFDERGANEAGFPWEKEYARINPKYFDAADARIAHLVDSGLAPCIVGAWGYHLPWLGVEKMKQHWRYIIARWGAYPAFWCTAGEGAMPYYLSSDKPKEAEFQKTGWTEIARYMREIDPFHRPITIHPTDLARNQVTDASVLDFEMLQTGHGDRASLMPTIAQIRASRAATPTMPTLNSEVCYEGILGTCPAEVVRLMSWTSMLGGTAGHTYGGNGIWQVNRKDQPYGPSPHGGNWGTTPWDEAMRLPGSAQTGYAKQLITQYQWWRLEPLPSGAVYVGEKNDGPIAWGDWIWHADDGDVTKNAPVEKRWFQKSFDVPAGAKVKSAVVYLCADDRFAASLNGQPIGESKGWDRPRHFDVAAHIKPGTNTLTIEAENLPGPVTANPASFIAGGEIVLENGQRITLKSDASWKSSKKSEGPWTSAKVSAPAAGTPWGEPSFQSATMPIAIAGIPGELRIVYVPEPKPVNLLGLETNVKWQAKAFDPVRGKTATLPAPTVSAGGSCKVDPPPSAQDWVIVLERQK